MIRKLVLLIFSYGYISLLSGNEMKESNINWILSNLSGEALPYVVIAYNDFILKNKSIDKYNISISESDNAIMVDFKPSFNKDEGMVLGGKTKNGRFVKYKFNKGDELNYVKSFAK